MAVLSFLLCAISHSTGQATSSHTSSLATQSPTTIGEEVRARAEAGDAAAQLALGTAYENGDGVTQSDQRAMQWYRKAGEHGNAAAQNRLGVMYSGGKGVEKDKTEAFRWFQTSARQKYPAAMFNLGTAYYNGDGVAVDVASAYAWFLLAREAGSSPAEDAVRRTDSEITQFEKAIAFLKIGDMYRKGEELPGDAEEVARWYRRAAEAGSNGAAIKLANLLFAHNDPKEDAEARNWCEIAAKHESAVGAYCMGLCAQQGRGTALDPAEAAKWYREAGTEGHPLALLKLGEMYWKGSGVKIDKETAYGFILLASYSDSDEAQRDKTLLEQEMDAKQLERGHKKAVEWVRLHPRSMRLKGAAPTD
jgi:uncharacterized protein